MKVSRPSFSYKLVVSMANASSVFTPLHSDAFSCSDCIFFLLCRWSLSGVEVARGQYIAARGGRVVDTLHALLRICGLVVVPTVVVFCFVYKQCSHNVLTIVHFDSTSIEPSILSVNHK